jgi:hypothetical protein
MKNFDKSSSGSGMEKPHHIAETMNHFTEAFGLSRYTLYMQDYGGPWHDDSGHWHRSYGNENCEFNENGLMTCRSTTFRSWNPNAVLAAWSASRRPLRIKRPRPLVFRQTVWQEFIPGTRSPYGLTPRRISRRIAVG